MTTEEKMQIIMWSVIVTVVFGGIIALLTQGFILGTVSFGVWVVTAPLTFVGGVVILLGCILGTRADVRTRNSYTGW